MEQEGMGKGGRGEQARRKRSVQVNELFPAIPLPVFEGVRITRIENIPIGTLILHYVEIHIHVPGLAAYDMPAL